MVLLFTYGTLKQGFCNEHINTGERVPGRYRTRDRLPLYRMNDGHASPEALAGMDRLERLGEPGGYTRTTVALERCDGESEEAGEASQGVTAHMYVRLPADVKPGEQRSEWLSEYTLAHQARFAW